jgi:hypothetical protein
MEQAVGLAASAYHRAGCLEGEILERLSELTMDMLKSQGSEAFREPALISDMICKCALVFVIVSSTCM